MTHQSSTQFFRMRGLVPDVLSSVFIEMEMQNASEILGHFAVADLQGMRVVRAKTSGGKFQVFRYNRHIREVSSQAIFICLPISGETSLQQNGRKCVLSKGDFGLLDSRFEYELDTSDFSDALWLRFAPAQMEARIAEMPNATARRIDGSSGLGLVASKFIRSIASEVESLQNHRAISFDTIAADLVSAAASPGKDSVFSFRLTSSRRTLDRARDYIERHLGEENLSPSTIAAGIGISTRYLSELFASEGTSPMGWTTDRRLTRCREVLERQPWTPGIIAHIAFQYGFGSIPSFNRSFKEKFGRTPREVMVH